MKLLDFYFLSCLLLLVSCGSNKKTENEVVSPTVTIADIGAGTYAVPCFQNKLASQGFGTTIYSKANMNLNEDGTGTNEFELYDDASCTNLLNSGTVTLLHYETAIVDGHQVLMMDQDDGYSVMRIWIPYKYSEGALYFDLNFSDGEAGPYLAEPTDEELLQFVSDPLIQGLLVQE